VAARITRRATQQVEEGLAREPPEQRPGGTDGDEHEPATVTPEVDLVARADAELVA